jgi:hypothetical protein
MAVNELRLHEFDQEMSKTKTTLERVAKDKWDWKPHTKSVTLGGMAGHGATLPEFMIGVITRSDYDVSTGGPPKVENDADLLGLFAKVSGQARQAVAGFSDEQLNETGSLKHNGQTLFAGPRYDML